MEEQPIRNTQLESLDPASGLARWIPNLVPVRQSSFPHPARAAKVDA
jgi:hypothetical protein